MKHQSIGGAVLAVAFAAAIVLVGGGQAANPQAQRQGPCSSEGTWQGAADNGFTWTNVITRGSDARGGQLDLDWVLMDPTLGGNFATAARATSGRGVWEDDGHQHAAWTWMAHGLDASGGPVYTIRASGTHSMPDCGRLEIEYALEVFLPFQNMATDSPVAVLRGTAVETRMPLVQPPGEF